MKECLLRKMELLSLETATEAKCIAQGLNDPDLAISRVTDIGEMLS
jgi:hypothetical protein